MFPSLNCRTSLQDPKRLISWRLLRIYRHLESTTMLEKEKSTGSFRSRVNQQRFPLSVSNCSPGLGHCQHMHTPTAGYQSTDTRDVREARRFQTATKTRILPKRPVRRPSFSFVKQSFFPTCPISINKGQHKTKYLESTKNIQARDATMLHDD